MDTVYVSSNPAVVDLVSAVTMVVGTVAIALFTGLLWRLNRQQHQLVYQAKLHVVEKQARFYTATREVRLELVLNNPSLEPAILHEWTVLVRDGDFQESIGDGSLGQTRLVTIPRFVGGRWWAVERGRPTAFSLAAVLPRAISGSAKIHVRIGYFGGRRSVTILEDSVGVTVV
jgi:hypothetical protein